MISKYDNINLGSVDNGIEVSFSIVMENEEHTFEPRMIQRKEFVFENANIDKAFDLMRSLVDYNIKKKKGESVTAVTLPV